MRTIIISAAGVGISPVITVVPAPPDVVERSQVSVLPKPSLTEALSVTPPPLQMVVGVTELVAQVGWATTVITALPVMSPAMAVQFASLRAVIVYVVVDPGFTANIYGEGPAYVTGVDVVPSYQVKFHGPVPDNATRRFVLVPRQMDAVPLITEVGLGITVTCTLPLMSREQLVMGCVPSAVALKVATAV